MERPPLGGRFSPESDTDYNRNVPRGKFVNTTRGSGAPFPETSWDDLALEFFSSSSNNDEENERSGRSASRLGQVGRWAVDTASSSRRARSVSRIRGGRGEDGGTGISSCSTSGSKNAISNEERGSRRRRSLSMARYRISDSETEVDSFQNVNKRAAAETPPSWNIRTPSGQKTTASSSRSLGRSRSHKNVLHYGYSSHSSALTANDSKDSHFVKTGFEKIIREVYAANKTQYPSADVANGRLCEAMKKEIRTEQNQRMGGNQTMEGSHDDFQSENSQTLQDFSGIKEKYASKSEQLEKRKQDLLTKSFLEEQQGQVFKLLEEYPVARTWDIADEPSWAGRKRTGDRSWISENLIEEAELIFEDFICNVEDADISSFDGERSDGSSTLLGTMKTKHSAAIIDTEPCTTPVEIDGVILPWLQWESSHDGLLSEKSKAHSPVTPKAIHWGSVKDIVPFNDQGGYVSSHGSWSPDIFESPQIGSKQDTRDSSMSCLDMAEYKRLENNEDMLFELYRQQNRVNSGGLLICTSALF